MKEHKLFLVPSFMLNIKYDHNQQGIEIISKVLRELKIKVYLL